MFNFMVINMDIVCLMIVYLQLGKIRSCSSGLCEVKVVFLLKYTTWYEARTESIALCIFNVSADIMTTLIPEKGHLGPSG
jgi:hypothetical protein